MKYCKQCILPETFPGISFDEQGICNHCRMYRGEEATASLKRNYEKKFNDLLQKERKKFSYDILVAYSGGKDSTYTLDVLVNRYRLRVLALTFDNGFISPRAEENIRIVCGNLKADLLMIRPNPEMLHDIFRTAAQEELYPLKTLERASTICTSCIGLIKNLILRTAIEKEIPFVGFGWSPGQAPVQASVMKTNPAMTRQALQTMYRPLYRVAGDAINPYFLGEQHFARPELFPWNVHPLAFLPYNEEFIINRIKTFGWVKPNDTDPNSSNCLLNAYANHIHRERYGFHPYVWEIANMVREGIMTRDEGLAKCDPPENAQMVLYSQKILQQN